MSEMDKVKKLLLEAETALEEFLHEHGGPTLGWPAKDHQAFLQLFLSFAQNEFIDNGENSSNNNNLNNNDDVSENKNMTHFNCESNDQSSENTDARIKRRRSCAKIEQSLQLDTPKLIKFIVHGLESLHLPPEEISTHVERYVQYINLAEHIAKLSTRLEKCNNSTSKSCNNAVVRRSSDSNNNKGNMNRKRTNKMLHETVHCNKSHKNILLTESSLLLYSSSSFEEETTTNAPKTNLLLNEELKMHLASIASKYTQAAKPVLYITQTQAERQRWAQIREDAKRKRCMLHEREQIKESNCKNAITESLWHEWHTGNEDSTNCVSKVGICSSADNALITTSNTNAIAKPRLADNSHNLVSTVKNKSMKTGRRARYDAPTASSAHRTFLSEKERHERYYGRLFTDLEYSEPQVEHQGNDLQSYSYAW